MLDVLAGRKTSAGMTGAVRMNGNLIRPETTSKYISYVAQARPAACPGPQLAQSQAAQPLLAGQGRHQQAAKAALADGAGAGSVRHLAGPRCPGGAVRAHRSPHACRRTSSCPC